MPNSLRGRLITSIAALLAIASVVLVALLLLQAGPRVHEETQSMSRFAANFARGAVRDVERADDPNMQLQRLVSQLQSLRHVTVQLLDAGEAPEQKAPERGLALSLLFALEGAPQEEPELVAVDTGGGRSRIIAIFANPIDEADEIMEQARQIAVGALLITIATFVLSSLVITRSLRPLVELRAALGEMEAGRFDVVVPEDGPQEINAVARGANTLASALADAMAENARLSRMLIRLQDDERTEIARDLHDELGPHLFSARARGAALKDELSKPAPDIATARAAVDSVLEQINDIQITNRRVLQKLAPAGLRELGLSAAIEGLAGRWRREAPDVDLRLALPASWPPMDETLVLTIFRVVQEGMTNAFRHADAKTISVSVSAVEAPGSDGGQMPSLRSSSQIEILVRDDGKGIETSAGEGFGLAGMRQRIKALGGEMTVTCPPGEGVCVRVLLFCT